MKNNIVDRVIPDDSHGRKVTSYTFSNASESRDKIGVYLSSIANNCRIKVMYKE